MTRLQALSFIRPLIFFPSFIFLSLNSWGSAPATVNAYYNSVLNRISTWVGYYIKLFCNEFYFHVMQKLIYPKKIASWAVVAQLFHWPKSYEIYPKNLTIHSFIVFPAGILQPPFSPVHRQSKRVRVLCVLLAKQLHYYYHYWTSNSHFIKHCIKHWISSIKQSPCSQSMI